MEKDAEVGFFLCGTREAVEKGRLLISYQISCIFDLEKLEVSFIVFYSSIFELPLPRNKGC